ncbi:putative transporter [Colletotrichum spaethianum]|uniref:Transporter n=1 Tax=Colletotrichum spaethianum TaxID=700344 RepID=A0AA37PD67_9PEZI|nr:putative transporter [Colletotrichum spaethianum]GKT50068.1 putative transporter [Colletotrichum spaethianum]
MTTSEKRSPSVERGEHTINHVDSVLHDEKPIAQDEENRDWTGSAKKTDPEEIKLVRKLDWRIMARLNNLEDDLGMSGTQFNTAVSILFVGYVLMQIPSNMLITRIQPGLYMSAWMLVWAVVSEVASRIAVLYCAQILATGLSSLIAAGIFAGMDGLSGISGWRWLFIVEGAATGVVAIFGFWLLPNTPLTTRWLSERERELAHSRMEKDKLSDSDNNKASAMDGLKQAVRDKRTWLFCLMQNFHLSACSFNSFFPTVVKTLGFNTTVTLLMTCPPFIFAGAAGILFGWSSGRLHERTWHITTGLGIAVVGFVMASATLNTAARYIACFIFAMGAYSVNSVIIGWASSTLSQTKEKKAVVLAMTNVGGQIGYIYGAYLWPSTDSPRYAIGFGASAGFSLLSICCAWWIRVLLVRENRRIRASTSEQVNLYGY